MRHPKRAHPSVAPPPLISTEACADTTQHENKTKCRDAVYCRELAARRSRESNLSCGRHHVLRPFVYPASMAVSGVRAAATAARAVTRSWPPPVARGAEGGREGGGEVMRQTMGQAMRRGGRGAGHEGGRSRGSWPPPVAREGWGVHGAQVGIPECSNCKTWYKTERCCGIESCHKLARFRYQLLQLDNSEIPT